MATFPFLLKITGATVLTGAITLGALTTWNGKDTVDHAISTIQEQASDLGLYEMNETRLVNKINELKILRDNLKGEVSALTAAGLEDDQTIASLQGNIEDLNGQIDTLETEVATANTNGETLAKRIDDLEAQLTAANADIERLQSELEANTSTDAPLTEAEMTTILETQPETVQ
ncbi:FlxA-like family protein [Niallia oryzisoli]|uniref:FlxA-like family protein n=1 Tax=Niallia oryzisoli TaxID=1737571 RepID=UPI0037363806